MDIEFDSVATKLSDGSFVYDVVASHADATHSEPFTLLHATDELTANFYSAILQAVTYQFETCQTSDEKKRYVAKIMGVSAEMGEL